MMQVSDLRAEPNERGGRIDLSWLNPAGANFAGALVLRRETAFPDASADSVARWTVHDEPATSTHAGLAAIYVDEPLQGETVYYYAVIPYVILPGPVRQLQAPSFVSAQATAPYQTAAHLYQSLPGLYRTFDTVLPPDAPGLDAQERARGRLRRLVEMFGVEFDFMRSFAAGVLNFHDVERVDGALLPLLAGWAGWSTNTSLDYDKQRNEIAYAPHYYRTAGVPANTRATINRLVTWDAHIKEFVHNVFLATHPEQLTLWESLRRNNVWGPPQTVTLDVAYEGRPSVLAAQDARQWLFYHARQSAARGAGTGPVAPGPTRPGVQGEDHWQIFYKSSDDLGWTPSRRLEADGEVNKYPAAVQDQFGNVWLFWTAYGRQGDRLVPQIKLRLMSMGRDRQQPRLSGTLAEPFAPAAGDDLTVTVDDSAGTHTKRVVFFADQFANLAQLSARDVADFLNRELEHVDVTVDSENRIVMTAPRPTANALTLSGSALAKLGLPGISKVAVTPAAAGLLSQRFSPLPLADGQTLSVRVDGGRFRRVTFTTENTPNIANATAASVVAVINAALPGVAKVGTVSGQTRVELASPTAGAGSLVEIDVDSSTAAAALGFGATLPATAGAVAPDDAEPSAFVDGLNRVWLFWSSRRNGVWKIWYARFDSGTNAWLAPKPLTTGTSPDREPSAVFDPSGAGRIWVFWSRKKTNGLWNVFWRTTTDFNFPVPDANWNESELQIVPPDNDNREPSGIVQAAGSVELYFVSNRNHGWQVWSNTITAGGQGTDSQITDGQFSRRTPVAVAAGAGRTRLFTRSNESQRYASSFYPSAETIDARYSGSTTVDTRNRLKIGLRLNIQDSTRYTYDAFRPKRPGEDPRRYEELRREHWYARDTVGIYLNPDTPDQSLVLRRRDQMEAVLQGSLPMQVRPVFIVDQIISEYFYTYDAPPDVTPVLIGERAVDTIISEVFGEPHDKDMGAKANFFWLRTWDSTHTEAILPDTGVSPPNLDYRLPLSGAGEPESGEL